MDAYLGFAEIYIAQNNRTDAVKILSEGIDITDDENLKTRLDDLSMEVSEQSLDDYECEEALSDMLQISIMKYQRGSVRGIRESLKLFWKDQVFRENRTVFGGLKMMGDNCDKVYNRSIIRKG